MAQIERNNTIDINHNEPAPSDTPPPSNSTSVNTGNESMPGPIGESGSNSTGSSNYTAVTTTVVITSVLPCETIPVDVTAPDGHTYTTVSVIPASTVTGPVLTTYYVTTAEPR